MLNEVFIAMGTMSVSPESRWTNRLQAKESWVGRCEGGGGVGDGGVAARLTLRLC